MRFNTQPPEGGWANLSSQPLLSSVSTHSRPKAAGSVYCSNQSTLFCFNTQPPEGGWMRKLAVIAFTLLFQHTAARRRLGATHIGIVSCKRFQHTAARRRLGPPLWYMRRRLACFNTQPPEGGWLLASHSAIRAFSFNTQPPEGGWVAVFPAFTSGYGFNTQPPEGGWNSLITVFFAIASFQHTAARRRLDR